LKEAEKKEKGICQGECRTEKQWYHFREA